MTTIADTDQIASQELSISASASGPSPRNSSKSRSFGRKVRAVAALSLIGSTLGVGLMASAGTAGAATPVITTTPTFECGAGTITIDKPALYESGQSVTWEPEIEEYTSAGWQYAFVGSQTTTASGLGSLAIQPFQLTAPRTTYFEVVDWFYTASTGWVYAQARAETGGAPINSYLCRTS
jgi:hypothetical protein